MLEYELYEKTLIIKSGERFETTVDVEYLSQVEIDNMLNHLVQNEVDDSGNPIQISNLTLPVYDLVPFDFDRDITSFIQVKKDTNEILFVLQIDHPLYSTSFFQKSPLNQENKEVLVDMLNEIQPLSFPGTIVDIHDQFEVDSSDEDDEQDNSSSFSTDLETGSDSE